MKPGTQFQSACRSGKTPGRCRLPATVLSILPLTTPRRASISIMSRSIACCNRPGPSAIQAVMSSIFPMRSGLRRKPIRAILNRPRARLDKSNISCRSLQKMYIVPRRMRRLQPLILLMPKNLSPLPILFMGARLIRKPRKQKFCAAPQREKAAGMIFPWSALNRKLPWRMQSRTCRFWPWPLRP